MIDPARSEAVAASYDYCRRRASHYENFPVGSVLFPRSKRDHFHAVYAFARLADDVADEGNDTAPARLLKLDALRTDLDRATAGEATDPVFIALADTMARCALPAEPFRKLLSAFQQDVSVKRYERFEDVLDYCARSANPVGEIVLRLFGRYDDSTAAASDAICTALQLVNFWQDVRVDFAKGRVYIPQEDLRRFGVAESTLANNDASNAFRALMRFEVERAETLFTRGAQLVPMLSGRLRIEISAVLASGRAVARQIRRNDFDVLAKSNRLSALSKGWTLVRAIAWPFA